MAETAAIAPDLLARWACVPVAILVDLAPELQIDRAIRPLRPAGFQPALCAPAVTAKCAPPDFGPVLRALDLVRAGDVLVIDAGGDAATAMIGEILGGHLSALGGVGLVCDGAVRDTGQLAKIDGLAIYSRWVNPRGPSSAEGTAINVPVINGGAAVQAGDLILGDDDGLACVPAGRLEDLIRPAEEKRALEDEWVARLGAGEAVRDVFGLD